MVNLRLGLKSLIGVIMSFHCDVRNYFGFKGHFIILFHGIKVTKLNRANSTVRRSKGAGSTANNLISRMQNCCAQGNLSPFAVSFKNVFSDDDFSL